MAFHSDSDSPSIFRDGKLKPGVYKIQNLYSQTYLDIHEHSKELCCRPAQNLEEGKGLVAPGEPEQFCTPMDGTANWCPVSVAAYPVAWRVETSNDEKHCGFEYFRFYWGTKKIAIDLGAGHKNDGAAVITHAETSDPWQLWKLIPVKAGGAFMPRCSSFETQESGSLPLYEGVGQQSSTQQTESERDNFGTIVTEVTVVTTRRRYRVEDA